LAACVRATSATNAVLCRIFTTATAGTGTVGIADAANTGAPFNATLNFTYVTGRSYLVVGTANGTTFTCSVKDLTTNQWLSTGGTFNSATRVAVLTVSSSSYAAKGSAGIQDFAIASDTTGAAYESIQYGTVGSLGALPPTATTLAGPTASTVGVPSANFTVGTDNPIQSGTVVITPSDGGSGGSFSPTSITLSNSVATGTFTYTAASAGTYSISTANNASLSNPSSLSVTASADQTFYCDNANIIKSPRNWVATGTAGAMAAESVWPGSYMRLRFNGTAISINVSTAGLSSYPWVLYQVNDLSPVAVKLSPGQTAISISSLSAGDHELNIIYQAKDDIGNAGSWANAQQLKIVSFSPTGGTGVLSAPSARPKKAVIFGDSITEGANIGTGAPTVAAAGINSAATASYSHHLGVGLNAEFDQCGMSGNGWSAAGYGGFPNFINSWNLAKSGVTRDFAGYDYIVVNHGRNDTSGIASSVVTNWLTAVRAVSQAHIFLLIPFAGENRAPITTGAANYIAANPSESKVHVIDLGSTFYQSVATGYYTLEGVHALPWNGGRLAAAYLGGIAGRLGTGAAAAPTYRGGFRKV
jgi:hypothetical protein